MSVEEQVCVMFAGTRGFIDKLKLSSISEFEKKFLALLKSNHSSLLHRIKDTGILSDSDI